MNPPTRREALRTSLATGALAALPGALRAQTGGPLRVAVIGHTGRGDYGHGIDKLWKRLDETEIVAIADPVEEGRGKASERLGVTPEKAFADHGKMLDEVRPDIVAIGPRHVDQHCAMAVAAAEAGSKGVYIEKPFCRNLAEADRIVSACRENGTKLAIAHRNRYHPVLPVVQKLVADGAIGRWLEIRARGKEDSRGGGLDLWVLGSHLLNLCHYFAGNPVACTASLFQDERPAAKEDVIEGSEGVGPLAGNRIHARYEMESGIPVFFDSIQNAGTREAGFGLQLIGTEGIIDIRADREPLAHILEGSPFRPVSEPGAWKPITSAGVGRPEPIEDIRDQVAGHLGPGEDGRVVVGMTMAAFESHRQGGARVPFPLEVHDNPLARL
jgi:predicted dehydrogenase